MNATKIISLVLLAYLTVASAEPGKGSKKLAKKSQTWSPTLSALPSSVPSFQRSESSSTSIPSQLPPEASEDTASGDISTYSSSQKSRGKDPNHRSRKSPAPSRRTTFSPMSSESPVPTDFPCDSTAPSSSKKTSCGKGTSGKKTAKKGSFQSSLDEAKKGYEESEAHGPLTDPLDQDTKMFAVVEGAQESSSAESSSFLAFVVLAVAALTQTCLMFG